jgi:hypothetical protein
MPTLRDFNDLTALVRAHARDTGHHEVDHSVDGRRRELVYVCNECETPDAVWTISLANIREALTEDLKNLWANREG